MAKAKDIDYKYTFNYEQDFLYVAYLNIDFIDGEYKTNSDAEAEYLRILCGVTEVGE